MNLTHLNPAGLHTNPAFSQGVGMNGGTLLVVGGQNGTDATGDIVSDDFGQHTKQAFRDVLTVLAEAGADSPGRPGGSRTPANGQPQAKGAPC